MDQSEDQEQPNGDTQPESETGLVQGTEPSAGEEPSGGDGGAEDGKAGDDAQTEKHEGDEEADAVPSEGSPADKSIPHIEISDQISDQSDTAKDDNVEKHHDLTDKNQSEMDEKSDHQREEPHKEQEHEGTEVVKDPSREEDTNSNMSKQITIDEQNNEQQGSVQDPENTTENQHTAQSGVNSDEQTLAKESKIDEPQQSETPVEKDAPVEAKTSPTEADKVQPVAPPGDKPQRKQSSEGSTKTDKDKPSRSADNTPASHSASGPSKSMAESSDHTRSMPEMYVDPSGNIREISSAGINTNQFFPDISLSPRKSEAVEKEDDSDFGRKTSAKDKQDSLPSRVASAAKTVHFDDSPVHVAVTPYEFEAEDADAQSDMDTVSDSISLPTTSPGPSRQGTATDVFSTQVDEETLEAAKVRQRRRTIILEPEQMEPPTPVLPSMEELVDGRAKHHYERGLDHLSSKEYEKAINCFNKAINLRPREVDYYIQRAESYLQLCDYQSAILNYKRACILEPENFTSYSRLAFIYFFQGQCLFDQKLYPEALEAFSRAAEMRPEIVGYHTRSIACLAALQRHGECLALVNKRLETEDKNADLYIMRARLHELFRNTTLCYYDVKDALMLDPQHQEAQCLMLKLEAKADELKQQAMQLNLLHRHRDALQKISIAIETNPSVPDYHILRGALHRRLGDFNTAIDDYLLALDKTDHNEESSVYMEAQRQLLLTYNDFAVECFTKGYFEEAIILLNKAIKGEKREKGLYINRGDCFFRQNHLQFAIADYHQALEIDPTDQSIRARIAIIHNEYGVQEYQEKNYQEAESRFVLAIQHNPKMGQYYVSRARCRLMMENIGGARNDLLMALHLDPSNEEILSMLARLFPGKTVKDVLHSKAAATAKAALDNLVVKAGPIRLQPISQQTEGQEDPEGQGQEATSMPPAYSSTWKPGQTFPDLRACMEERDFHIKIAREKQKINRKIKGALHIRESLRNPVGRVQPLPEAIAVPRQGGNPFRGGEVAVDASGMRKSLAPTGWRTFSLGIGLTGIPDKV